MLCALGCSFYNWSLLCIYHVIKVEETGLYLFLVYDCLKFSHAINRDFSCSDKLIQSNWPRTLPFQTLFSILFANEISVESHQHNAAMKGQFMLCYLLGCHATKRGDITMHKCEIKSVASDTCRIINSIWIGFPSFNFPQFWSVVFQSVASGAWGFCSKICRTF